MLINKQEQYTPERFKVAINSFSGEYEWLSNLFQLKNPIVDALDGLEFWNSEGYYMAKRVGYLNRDARIFIAKESKKGGLQARRVRRMFIMESDEQKRANYMMQAVMLKYDFNSDLAQLLFETGDVTELIEGNHWKDDLFGVRSDTLRGANVLGKIHMAYRFNQYNQVA